MKKLLLLISLVYLIDFSVHGQQLVRTTKTPDSKEAYQKSTDDTQDQPKKKRKKKAKKKKKKSKAARKEKEIIHTAPDQQAIDSIKAEKMKNKK